MPIKYLLQSTDFFREPMALVNSDGTIDAVNRTLARELDASAGSLVGKRLESIAASSAGVIEQYLQACFDSQAVVNGSLLLRRRADIVAMQARGIAHSTA